jgi:hypothetical protein
MCPGTAGCSSRPGSTRYSIIHGSYDVVEEEKSLWYLTLADLPKK